MNEYRYWDGFGSFATPYFEGDSEAVRVIRAIEAIKKGRTVYELVPVEVADLELLLEDLDS